MKNIAIIGSTGSIGRQTLDVVRQFPQKFKVVALTAGSNAQLLSEQAAEFEPQFIGIADESKYKLLKVPSGCTAQAGADAAVAAARLDADVVCVSVVGMRGLSAVIAALESGKDVALANKESLVAGGSIVMRLAERHNAKILPIDSEHSAVWQCLTSGKPSEVRRIILTASGGPFRGMTRDALKNVTPAQAANHPTWSMGRKISVDSATMMNKGLEIIEARWLFDTQNIDYILHPQSIVHSMVEYCDGAVLAQLSPPDMRLPILLALSYPDRGTSNLPSLDFSQQLTFLPPDEENFPMPAYAKQAMRAGGNAACILNAANEAAVELFLNEKIGFTDIFDIVEQSLAYNIIANPTADDIFETHKSVTEKLMRDYKK